MKYLYGLSFVLFLGFMTACAGRSTVSNDSKPFVAAQESQQDIFSNYPEELKGPVKTPRRRYVSDDDETLVCSPGCQLDRDDSGDLNVPDWCLKWKFPVDRKDVDEKAYCAQAGLAEDCLSGLRGGSCEEINLTEFQSETSRASWKLLSKGSAESRKNGFHSPDVWGRQCYCNVDAAKASLPEDRPIESWCSVVFRRGTFINYDGITLGARLYRNELNPGSHRYLGQPNSCRRLLGKREPDD